MTFDFTEELIQESLAISLADVLANSGGFIGLFTGFSLYTFVGYAEKSLENIYERMKIWKPERKGRKTTDKCHVSDVVITELDI